MEYRYTTAVYEVCTSESHYEESKLVSELTLIRDYGFRHALTVESLNEETKTYPNLSKGVIDLNKEGDGLVLTYVDLEENERVRAIVTRRDLNEMKIL